MSTQYSDAFPVSPDWCGLNEAALRQQLLASFTQCFDRYEALFDCLASEAGSIEKSIALRHPLIFYYGHTATFFVNKLLLAKLIPERINPGFEAMFAVGVDEMSWDDLNDAHYDWPTVAEVKAYRNEVRATVLQVIAQAPWQGAIGWGNPWWSILMGIEHELIHLETSSVLIRQHRLQYVRSQSDWIAVVPSNPGIDGAPRNALIDVAAGSVRMGKGSS